MCVPKFASCQKIAVLLCILSVLGVGADAGEELINLKPLSGQKEEIIFQKAIAGDANAQYELGWLAVKKDDWALAANWFQKAADQGDPHAKFNLGQIIANSDAKLSFRYCLDAAEAGVPPAMLEVGERLIDGTKGAGDALAAGILLGVHEEWLMADNLKLGVCAAAASLFHPSCSAGILSLNDCLALAERYEYKKLSWTFSGGKLI